MTRTQGLRVMRGPILVLMLMAALASLFLMVRPVGAQAPADDGCDPNEQIACLPLPEEAAPSGGHERPSIAAPSVPCPPVVFGDAEARIAAPAPPSDRCDQRGIIATVNYANVLYARALRSLNTQELPNAWTGDALNQVRGIVADLRSRGHYGTPELRSISLEELRSDGSRAHVRTLENWLYQERALLTGRVVVEENQWVINEYVLDRQGGSWFVSRNDVTVTPGPLPPPSMPCILIFPPPPGCDTGQPAPSVDLSVTSDRRDYHVLDPIVATITNHGTESVWGGGGFACGMVALEMRLDDQWQPAPGGADICPAIAIGLAPGESRTETIEGHFVGTYRLVVQATSDSGAEAIAYSEPFVVGP
jgi:hypothetical protein